jgi:hypothetical protein
MDGRPLRIKSSQTSVRSMPGFEPNSLAHLLTLVACATTSFVIASLSLVFWSLLTLILGFLVFCFYLAEIIDELLYLHWVRKENKDD